MPTPHTCTPSPLTPHLHAHTPHLPSHTPHQHAHNPHLCAPRCQAPHPTPTHAQSHLRAHKTVGRLEVPEAFITRPHPTPAHPHVHTCAHTNPLMPSSCRKPSSHGDSSCSFWMKKLVSTSFVPCSSIHAATSAS
eukprot:364614-Chlamydomonas_euryale.AAC.2